MAVDVLFTRRSAPDNPTHDDPTKWARYLPVDVRPMGAPLGTEEQPGNGLFYIISITDVALTVEQVKARLLDRDEDAEGNPRYVRAWRIMVENLPNPVRNTLNNTGRYSTTLAAIRNYIQHLRTGETY